MRCVFLLSLVLVTSIAAASEGLNSLVFADGLDRTPADFAGQSINIITLDGKC